MSWSERRSFDDRSKKLPNLPAQPLTEEARQAIIEHRRLMRDQRAWAAANRARIDAEWDALTCPPRTIEGHLALVNDPERWARLQADWEGR